MTSTTAGDGTAVDRPTLLPTLTSLRFVIAVVIFGFHATDYVLFRNASAGQRYLDLVTMGGWAGMTFFFILSGFVLTWVARPGDRVRTFWRRRIVRIMPNHLLMFAVTAILGVTVLGTAFNGGHALLNIFLLQAWSPDLWTRIAFNSVSWSLSAELLFYLCFPVLLYLIRKIRPERLWAWTIGVLAVIAVVVPFAMFLVPHQERMVFIGLSMEQFFLLFHFPPVRMLEFIVGILLARIVMTGQRVPVSFGGAIAITVTAYALGLLFPPEFRMVGVMAAPLALVIAAAAVSDLNRTRPTLLSSRPMEYLGNLSYAFYLVHLQVLIFGSHWLGTKLEPGFSTPVAIAIVALFFLISVALSWVLFTFVEQPMMRRFGRHHLLARRTVQAPATVDRLEPEPADPPATERRAA